MARLSRQESQNRTRELLVESARTALASRGYSGASVDVIAETAGFSKGAFYSNFDSKEAIFMELLRQHMAREREELERILGDGTSTAALDTWLESLNRDADWAVVAVELQLHARRSEAFADAYQALNDAHRAALGVLLDQLFASAGRRPPAASTEIAGALMALANGLALQRRAAGEHHNAADPSGPLIGLVLQGLIASAAPAATKRPRASERRPS